MRKELQNSFHIYFLVIISFSCLASHLNSYWYNEGLAPECSVFQVINLSSLLAEVTTLV